MILCAHCETLKSFAPNTKYCTTHAPAFILSLLPCGLATLTPGGGSKAQAVKIRIQPRPLCAAAVPWFAGLGSRRERARSFSTRPYSSPLFMLSTAAAASSRFSNSTKPNPLCCSAARLPPASNSGYKTTLSEWRAIRVPWSIGILTSTMSHADRTIRPGDKNNGHSHRGVQRLVVQVARA